MHWRIDRRDTELEELGGEGFRDDGVERRAEVYKQDQVGPCAVEVFQDEVKPQPICSVPWCALNVVQHKVFKGLPDKRCQREMPVVVQSGLQIFQVSYELGATMDCLKQYMTSHSSKEKDHYFLFQNCCLICCEILAFIKSRNGKRGTFKRYTNLSTKHIHWSQRLEHERKLKKEPSSVELHDWQPNKEQINVSSG